MNRIQNHRTIYGWVMIRIVGHCQHQATAQIIGLPRDRAAQLIRQRRRALRNACEQQRQMMRDAREGIAW